MNPGYPHCACPEHAGLARSFLPWAEDPEPVGGGDESGGASALLSFFLQY